jgi:hypothetical protein
VPPTAPTTRLRDTAPSGDGSAAPKVVDRGAGSVAIARSLLLYGRWLEWHDPDPALVQRAYAAGSPPARVVDHDVVMLRRTGRRLIEVDRAPLDLTIISATPNVVSFRLTEQLAHRELVDANGRVIGRNPATTEHYLISIMRFAPDAPWRVNLVQLQGPKIEVQL